MKLILATQNPHKVEEVSRLLSPLGVSVHSQDSVGVHEEPVEDGTTFAENAAIKARFSFEKTGLPTMADDSGLVVDALNGAPGIYSARYAGEHGTSKECVEKLLRELKDVPKEKRTARFVCALVFIDKDGKEYIFEEPSAEGYIGFAPRGNGGFGYDPVFMVGERSFAELSPNEKDEMSHRGKAMRRFAQWLEQGRML